ncbi:HlyD family efflux transporter periplasmic adaptor subunit [Roseateles cellulosilyticus]|uniref:HlyD family efflux transporter periplasmic adaptor subunit n=1 Tax=Pelomonas cellulosilytica TaxID=2906762 RepID=A0ABS8XWW9_9BURK|nr:HlyD family efflux transporter periplasmic adaptor subunit [Pelomonas sp. P8]
MSDHEVVLPPPSATPQAAELAPALALWLQRLHAAGLACQGVALHAADAAWRAPFERADVADAWAEARARVTRDSPVALSRVATGELLVATHLALPSGHPGIVGALLSPPHNDRSLQLLLLSLGWLQLTLSAASLAHNQRAAELLELMGHVASQRNARAAAQDWVNRTAAWARRELAPASALQLSLFEARQDRTHWWVAADVSHAETASPAVRTAGEVAQRAYVEGRELTEAEAWALPLLDQGEVVAVLVAQGELTPAALQVLRTSAALAEPLLRHWRAAELPLPRQTWRALRRIGGRLSGPGHWAWKVGAAAAVLMLAVLVGVPVDDRVTAHTVIEGRTRQLVTAPFEGFIAEALVRPGDRVRQGQVLLRLDDRDLVLEQAKLRGERDQAAGKLRQAMADRDAANVALASAELQGSEGQLALVEAKLARTRLVAPMDGLVVTGDWVQQLGGPVELGKEMFEIASEGYRVVLHVPERDIARVRTGQRGVLRLAGQPHEGHDFEVSRVTATASVQDGTNGFRAEAAWVGEVPPLSPGMQGVAKVVVGKSNLLTIWTRESLDWLRLKLWQYWI